MADWSSCPRCGSGRIKQASKQAFLITLLVGTSFLVWLGIMLSVFLVTIPIILIFIFIMFLAKETWECQECKHKWLFKRVK